jgi:hypothetical protein
LAQKRTARPDLDRGDQAAPFYFTAQTKVAAETPIIVFSFTRLAVFNFYFTSFLLNYKKSARPCQFILETLLKFYIVGRAAPW